MSRDRKMSTSFSDISSDFIKGHIDKAFEHLTEVSQYAPVANIENHSEVEQVSQMAFLLTLAAKQLAEGNRDQAQDTLRSVHKHLSDQFDE
jgi:hypothetical protein